MSARVYIVIVPLSRGTQVNVLSIVRAVSNCQRDSSSSIRGSENCYTSVVARYPMLHVSCTYNTHRPYSNQPSST